MLARTENGQVVELRDLTIEQVPEHKRSLWLPVEEETVGAPGPLVVPVRETVVEATRVVRRTTYTALSEAAQKGCVKAEAGKRILARYPEYKQLNMLARSVELTRKGAALTELETAEAVALEAVWVWIKAVRAASDALEAMVPIPSDYADAKWWPA